MRYNYLVLGIVFQALVMNTVMAGGLSAELSWDTSTPLSPLSVGTRNMEASAQLHWDISTPPSPLSAGTMGVRGLRYPSVSPTAHHVVPTRETTTSMGEGSPAGVAGAASLHSAYVTVTELG